MYGMVLMAAVTGSADMTEIGHKSGSCTGVVVGAGCTGSGYSCSGGGSCTGKSGGLFHKNSGGCTGKSGGLFHRDSGGCTGKSGGGLFHRNKGGYSCTGGSGCYGSMASGAGCTGVIVVAPKEMPKVEPKKEPMPEPKPEPKPAPTAVAAPCCDSPAYGTSAKRGGLFHRNRGCGG